MDHALVSGSREFERGEIDLSFPALPFHPSSLKKMPSLTASIREMMAQFALGAVFMEGRRWHNEQDCRSPERCAMHTQTSSKKQDIPLEHRSRVHVRTQRGGGHSNPFDRRVQDGLTDVRPGWFTIEDVSDKFGVVGT
ncbi:hypothetical protein [Shimia sp.]|uniref:hypothetical protein n=1 Tax=Shimia sp. TaxID=1954381 RepID=UPI00329A20BB